MILPLMKYRIGLNDKQYIRSINLGQNIFHELDLILLLYLMMCTRQTFCICPMIRLDYLFCLNVLDVASRYKVSIPIGAISVKDRQGILTSKTIARSLEKIYNNPECPLIWPKVFL